MKEIVVIFLIIINLTSCGVQKLNQDITPEYETFKIESKEVGETRIINIWKPEEYSNNLQNYDVLYMADGGVKEDFPHIANTIAKLIKEKSIQPIILVGIENTVRGRDLTGSSQSQDDAKYCPLTDGASNFRAFINKELIPEINLRYRTSKKKGIIGESLSGLFVMETFMLHPESFDFYIAFDPSLWWNNHFLVKSATETFNNFPSNDIKLWFAGSNAEDISIHTKELNRILKTNAPPNLDWKYSDEPKEKHHTIFRATKEKALIWMLNEQLK